MFRWKAMERYFRNGKIGGHPLGNCQRIREWSKIYCRVGTAYYKLAGFRTQKIKG